MKRHSSPPPPAQPWRQGEILASFFQQCSEFVKDVVGRNACHGTTINLIATALRLSKPRGFDILIRRTVKLFVQGAEDFSLVTGTKGSNLFLNYGK
jgi:hypothetical protein